MTRNEAAAAIEALTAKLAKAVEERDTLRLVIDANIEKHRSRAEAAEAKLAKAVEGLREIAAEASVPVHTWKNGINFKKMYEGWRKVAVQRINKARATLAEIEGEKT
jgi:hypothetical protein